MNDHCKRLLNRDNCYCSRLQIQLVRIISNDAIFKSRYQNIVVFNMKLMCLAVLLKSDKIQSLYIYVPIPLQSNCCTPIELFRIKTCTLCRYCVDEIALLKLSQEDMSFVALLQSRSVNFIRICLI